MLITVSGAQGSGKSTVLSAIEQLGYPVVQRKTSRSILSDWGKTLDQINDDPELSILFQDEVLIRKQTDELDAVEAHGYVFTERTYMDLFVYALINLGKFNEYSDWLDSYYLRCAEAQKSYTNVFYLQSGLFNVQADGVRGSNKHYSRLVDLVMYDYTKSSTPADSFVLIDVPGVDQRVDIIKSHLTSIE